MNNKAILTKAIAKAQKNGFLSNHKFSFDKNMGWTYMLREQPKQASGSLTANVTGLLSESDILFNHDFAKALWGEGLADFLEEDQELWSNTFSDSGCAATFRGANWQWHLQQMVVSPDPVKYLGEHLE